ncbi:PHD finger protein 12 [Frankliniella fusca]|uniref:PHD finger protein 12 n=1 Tax=Frankliniella fusca TaxID=407009 RepID=A0AAE1H2U2_9NEOP|nr:PHD finger protein 12 [Frankliniella fusca]
MTSMDYDLDSSGGLMPKIQALIAPPESDETSKPNKRKEGLDLHPYYKRPGKGHNRDCCDACNEGGNLICCDKCPASFHLACHDPPLEDEDIPLGQWLCHKCRMTAGLPPLREVLKKAREKANPESADGPFKEEPANDTSTRSRSRTSSSASLESNKSRGRGRAAVAVTQSSGPVTTATVAAGPDSQSALETLIAAASSMNPTQFDLPREMVLPINFPGTDRAPTRGKKASASKRSRTHELDNGLVPLPAKTCFECRKSCKRAPLLACDYCPLLFHLDCLDPPLTSLPCGRWMCPNHVEQAIDEKLLTSLSVTQRVALWDKYTGPIDHDAVKTEFLQKTRRLNPPFRFKVKLAPRNRAKVPNSVKEMYKNRQPLIPTLREVLRDNEVGSRWMDNNSNSENNPNISDLKKNFVKLEGPTEIEQEEWLSGIVALQTSIACHLGSKRRKKSLNSEMVESQDSVKAEMSDSKSCGNDTQQENHHLSFDDVLKKPDLNPISNGMLDYRDSCSDIKDVQVLNHNRTIGFNGTVQTVVSNATKIQNGNADNPLGIHGNSNNNQTYLRDEEKKQLKKMMTDQTQDQDNFIEESLDSIAPGTDIDKLDSRLIRLLAFQRLQQLTQTDRSLPNNSFSSKVQPSVPQRRSTFWPSAESGLKPRALLTPLSGSQPPMPIYYRVMEIGTGGDMDICLSYYGHCNYVTAKHAVIICDEVNRHYELMNYSEHGTTVDNVLYSCDFSEKTPAKEQPLSPTATVQHHGRRSGGNSAVSSASGAYTETTDTEVEVPPLIQKIRAVVDKRRGVIREEDCLPEPCKMPADIGKEDFKCICRSSSSSMIGGSGAGWEGTALLNHGSFIKFGCIQFTFSVLNFVSPPAQDVAGQENSYNSVEADDKGSIPHRILKRERDSTSSSTLTVSPSPPPDRAALAAKHALSSRDSRNQVQGYDDDDDDDDDDDEDEEEDDEDEDEVVKEELNEESDKEEMGEDMETEKNGNNEEVNMQESPTKPDNSEISQSNCVPKLSDHQEASAT